MRAAPDAWEQRWRPRPAGTTKSADASWFDASNSAAMHSGFVAIVDKPASAMRCGHSAIITARSPAPPMPCQRAILGGVRPRPKQRPILGSIMQTAIHGVSLFIQTKDPGAKPRSSPFQRCHDWINILSIFGDHRLVELLARTGLEKTLLNLAQKKAGIRKRPLATAAEIVCCPIPAEQIPAR